ncbi:lipopolysaccharide biosynthesis protein [Vibrio wakamikoensis]|uniref:lipopolysaccharide biosynthesis protein n=1 Tax=Vibrio wakamikoensis TaxID=2910251 RepID=UPI003D1F3B4F
MIEKRFNEFRVSVKPSEFNDIDFLLNEAKQLDADDPQLANRIRLRVKNLKVKQQSTPNDSVTAATVQTSAVKSATLRTPSKPIENNQASETTASNGATKAPSTATEADSKAPQWYDFAKPLIEWISRRPFVALVVIPTLLFSLYQTLWASERFESQAQVTVQQPDGMATMDASMALLSGLGVSSSQGTDSELVKAYIYSNDMIEYLNRQLNMRQHFSDSGIDYFSRLHDSDSRETAIEYYKKRVKVEVNTTSGVITIYGQAFSSEYAQQLTQTIVGRAEWYINSIGHQLAQEQLTFIQGEHEIVAQKLRDAQTALLGFQQKYNLIDPTAEGAAIQQIAYGLEGQIATKNAELTGLTQIMSAQAPQVKMLQNEIAALEQQLVSERTKLATSEGESFSVSQILATFTDLRVKMELALQAYTSSQVSLEKSRIEAYRQLKYLVTVEAATQPEDNQYPEVLYNITLFAILASMVFAIGRIIVLTIYELK